MMREKKTFLKNIYLPLLVGMMVSSVMCQQDVELPLSLRERKSSKEGVTPAAPVIIPGAGTNKWRAIQEKAKAAVVQLFVYKTHFNWFEPYKSPKQSAAAGSGFFVFLGKGSKKAGIYILTNYHVVHEATSIKIQLPPTGKAQFDVEIVGVSPDRDLAALKLTDAAEKELLKLIGTITTLELGDSDKIVRTQEVLSLGYPLGQQGIKSTHGIVSGREQLGRESYIQMTAPINLGNSGGPIFTEDGAVVGIATAGVMGAQNVGYIIPIKDVESIIGRLLHEKIARQPFLGVEMNYSQQPLIDFLGNPAPGGAYVSRVYKNTFFDKLGVKEGDMIYEVAGYTLDPYAETSVSWSEDKVPLINVVNRLDVDESVKIVLYRNGKRLDLEGKLSLSEELAVGKVYPKFERVDYDIIGGLVVMELKLNHVIPLLEKRPSYIRFTERENCYEPKLIITHVFPDSPAHKARFIQVGDLIETVNGQEVKTLNDFRDAIRNHKQEPFIRIKNEEHRLLVLSVTDVIEQEGMLASLYFFKKSDLVHELEAYHKPAAKAAMPLVPLVPQIDPLGVGISF